MGTKAVICYPSNRFKGINTYDICLVKTSWDQKSLECMLRTFWEDDDKVRKLMWLKNIDEFEETYEDTKANQSKEILPGRYHNLNWDEIETRMEELECGLLFLWSKEYESFTTCTFNKHYVVFARPNTGIEKKWFQDFKEAVDHVESVGGIKPRYFKVEKGIHVEQLIDLEPWRRTDIQEEHLKKIINIIDKTKERYLTKDNLSNFTYYHEIKSMIKAIEEQLNDWVLRLCEEVVW